MPEGFTKTVELQLRKVNEGKTFNKYTLLGTEGMLKEGKEIKVNMMTTNKNNVLECRSFVTI